MKRRAHRPAALASAILCLTLHAATEPVHTGCVTRTEAGDLTYCEPNACSVLTGKLAEKKLAGHTVQLRGAIAEATNETPRTITIKAVVSIGPACTETCSPRPPTHRGIGLKKDKPGVEGGTPGRTTDPAP